MCSGVRLQVIAVRDGNKVHISCHDIVVGDISEFRLLRSTTYIPCMLADDDVPRRRLLPVAASKPDISTVKHLASLVNDLPLPGNSSLVRGGPSARRRCHFPKVRHSNLGKDADWGDNAQAQGHVQIHRAGNA